VRALVEAGVVSLGIDITPAAVRRARRVGAPVLHRSVFDGVPGAGRYATALLLDGNIGIGGRPELLLRRTAELLRPGGRILIETTERGGRTVATDNAKHARSPGRAAWFDEPRPSSPETAARFVVDHEPGPWFEWRDIAAAEVRRVAAELGFTLRAQWDDRHRHFVRFDTRIDRR
jgi:SAM-dependent methyltransferase